MKSLMRFRYTGWLLLGLYVVLAVVGITLSYRNNAAWLTGEPPTINDQLSLFFFGVWVLVGALLIFQKPENPAGWLLSIGPILLVMDQFAFGYAYSGTIIRPGSLPFTDVPIVWLYLIGHTLFLVPLSLLLQLFPTGRPITRSWRPLIWFTLGITAIYMVSSVIRPLGPNAIPFRKDLVSGLLDLGEGTLDVLEWVTWVATVGIFICLVASVISLAVRLIHSRGIERQQLKWIVFAAFPAAPGFVALLMSFASGPQPNELLFNLSSIFLGRVFIPGLPIALAIAILRHRLFDIDIIIRRTLSYAVLTTVLGVVYYAGVLLLQSLFDSLTGEADLPIVTVLSTLAIAALFNPLRHRIQGLIDRRFYRRKYDIERTLARFASAARDEVDLERLAKSLLKTVEETMQPENTTLWLGKTKGS